MNTALIKIIVVEATGIFLLGLIALAVYVGTN